jgi:hypothetical protein
VGVGNNIINKARYCPKLGTYASPFSLSTNNFQVHFTKLDYTTPALCFMTELTGMTVDPIVVTARSAKGVTI